MAEQVSLSYINTTTSGINMIASWVKLNSTHYNIEHTYNPIYPIIGGFFLSILLLSLLYIKPKNKHSNIPLAMISLAFFILTIMSGFIGYDKDPLTGEYIEYCHMDKCNYNHAHVKVLNSKSIRRNMFHSEMNNLLPNTTYIYRMGSNKNGWSKDYTFTTLSHERGITEPLRLAVYGDFGLTNSESLDELKNNLAGHNYDMVLHIGDMAYNLDSNDGEVGDSFMNMIEPIASKVPYMTCPGNHEEAANFTYYTRRYNMPGVQSGSNNNMYYSFDVGDIHFTAISSELYYFKDDYTDDHIIRQYNWLKTDLEGAQNKSWRIMFAHRPMYCSLITNSQNQICTSDTARMRDGTTYNGDSPRVGGLEHLLMDYNVDLFFAGHMHSYERLWPTYRQQVIKKDYNNPGGPVHIITGSAGCNEDLDHFDSMDYPWSAFKSDSYGFGMLNIINSNRLEWRQLLAKDSSVLDRIIINK